MFRLCSIENISVWFVSVVFSVLSRGFEEERIIPGTTWRHELPANEDPWNSLRTFTYMHLCPLTFCGKCWAAAGSAWAHFKDGICFFCFCLNGFQWAYVCVPVMRKINTACQSMEVRRCVYIRTVGGTSLLGIQRKWLDGRWLEAFTERERERQRRENRQFNKGTGVWHSEGNETPKSARLLFKFVRSHFINMPPSVKF